MFFGRIETRRSNPMERGDCLPLRGTRRREKHPPCNDMTESLSKYTCKDLSSIIIRALDFNEERR